MKLAVALPDARKLRVKMQVLSVSILPNTLVSLKLKNLEVPPDVNIVKEPENMFDVGGMMQSVMQQQQKMFFRQMYESRIYTKLILTPQQFKELRVTVGDELIFELEVPKVE